MNDINDIETGTITTTNNGSVAIETGVVLPDFRAIEDDIASKKITDVRSGAIKFCFLGFGQAGTAMVNAFWKQGQRRCAVCNTTKQDMADISVPLENSLVMGDDSGAGKDPNVGDRAARLFGPRISELIRHSFGAEFDRILCLAGLGGGTGTLGILTGISKAKAYSDLFLGRKSSVGAIVTLPQRNEGLRVGKNAYSGLEQLRDMVLHNKISPLVVVDNDRMSRLYSGLPVGKLWEVIDSNVASIFLMFNTLAALDSRICTFDKADLSAVLDSGIIVFGITVVGQWEDREDLISSAIRKNLQAGMFVDDFDLTTASIYAMIVTGPETVLNEQLKIAQVDAGVELLNSEINSDSLCFRGIFPAKQNEIVVYTMLGGLSFPDARLNSLLR